MVPRDFLAQWLQFAASGMILTCDSLLADSQASRVRLFVNGSAVQQGVFVEFRSDRSN